MDISSASALAQILQLSNRFASVEATAKAAQLHTNQFLKALTDTNDKLSAQGIRLTDEVTRISEILLGYSTSISENPEFVALSELVGELQGEFFARPPWSSFKPATPYANQIWLNLESGKAYRWNGSYWLGPSEVWHYQPSAITARQNISASVNLSRASLYSRFMIERCEAQVSGGYTDASRYYSLQLNTEALDGTLALLPIANPTYQFTSAESQTISWDINHPVLTPISGLTARAVKQGTSANLLLNSLCWIAREIA